jgi:lipopolysaccharide export system protein LptA
MCACISKTTKQQTSKAIGKVERTVQMIRKFQKLSAPLTIAVWVVFAAGAVAQTVTKHDTDQPIDIEADSLEVQQDNNLAIFTGNVDVKQGDIRLQAKELRVSYGQADGDNEAAANVSGSIRRIDAKGNVFMSTPTETAKGDNGTYDVVKKVITMKGNVVLTRGKNVLRGDQLVYNMVTGRSELKGGGKTRVKGIFVPEKKKK